MANSLDMQITEEGPRNAIVKITGLLDAGDVSLVSAISPTDFHNNDQNLVLTGFRANTVHYTMSDSLSIGVFWNSVSPQQIYALAGHGDICGNHFGGFNPDTSKTGYDGTLNIVSIGAPNGTGDTVSFTLVLELVKLYTR